MAKTNFLFTTLIILGYHLTFATPIISRLPCNDTTKIDSVPQKDAIDILHSLFNRKALADTQKVKKRTNISVLPVAGYTLSTGFTAGVGGIAAFFTTKNHNEHESIINFQAFYTSHHQQIFATQSNIFTNKDQFKFVTDLRTNKYPDITYGLGDNTTTATADSINYNYIRIYQTILKKIGPNLYAGGGYCLDYHYNIVESGTANNTVSSFDKYGETSNSRSSGYNLNIVFDTRYNPINPLKGTYANIFYRGNLTALGGDSKWSSIQIDLRKYFKLSNHSKNILGIWSYTWLTLAGKQPYLDLPSIGNDTYNNTGRGYPIGRFRGKNMFYLESEYRFGITRDGLLGGVVFANLQSYPRDVIGKLKTFIPAGGSGLRIKVNKRTNTNVAIDYGIGIDGSHGIFVNLGEIF